MAAPSYATDLTDILVPPIAASDFSAFGGGASGLNTETDYYIIDSTCGSKNAWASDYKGMMHDNVTDVTIPTGDALFMWLTHLTPNSLATEALGGLRVLMANANTESTFDEWYVAGSDTLIYDDRWLCAVVDPDETPDNDNGATQNYSWFGAGANLPSGGPTKGAPFAIGAIRHGRAFTCTAGDLGNGYATFAGAAAYNDDSTRRFGQFQLSKGTYSMQGLFAMGTSDTAVDFRDSNRTIFVIRTPKVGSGFNGFEVAHNDSNVEWSNISIQALGTTSPGYFRVMHALATVALTSCTFADFGETHLGENTTLDRCTFNRSGKVYQNGATITGCTFDQTTLVMDRPDLVTDCSFKSDGTASAYGISNEAVGVFSFTGNTFSGFGATGGNTAAIENATGGATLLNVVGTSPTYNNVNGSSFCEIHRDVWSTSLSNVTSKALSSTVDLLAGNRYYLYLHSSRNDGTGRTHTSVTGTTTAWTKQTQFSTSGSYEQEWVVFTAVPSADELNVTLTFNTDVGFDFASACLVAGGDGTVDDTTTGSGFADPDTLGEMTAFSPTPTSGDGVVAFWPGGDGRPELSTDTGGDSDHASLSALGNGGQAGLAKLQVHRERATATDSTPGYYNDGALGSYLGGEAFLVAESSSSVEMVSNPVTVTATSTTPDGTPVGSCRVLVYATSTTGSLPANASVTIVNSGNTATVTHTAHGLKTNDLVDIRGASLVPNLGVYQITVTGVNTYTYTMGSSPGSSPTGTITSTFVFLQGTTNATTGILSTTLSIPGNQSVTGWARKSSAADNPKYQQGPIAGTVSASTGASFAAVMIENE